MLTALTRKNKMDSRVLSCFQGDKTVIGISISTEASDLNRPFILWTDASKIGFGVVLEQESEDGERHPRAYAS